MNDNFYPLETVEKGFILHRKWDRLRMGPVLRSNQELSAWKSHLTALLGQVYRVIYSYNKFQDCSILTIGRFCRNCDLPSQRNMSHTLSTHAQGRVLLYTHINHSVINNIGSTLCFFWNKEKYGEIKIWKWITIQIT